METETQSTDIKIAEQRLREYQSALKDAQGEITKLRRIEELVFDLSSRVTMPPAWQVTASNPTKSPGIPALLSTDWHIGEKINKDQIGGVNAYNLKVARRRTENLALNTLELLFCHMAHPVYPGIVYLRGGDLLSGNIHEELMAGNEVNVGPAFIAAVEMEARVIRTLASKFPYVTVASVDGNHTRLTKRQWSKNGVYVNLDWVAAKTLESMFRHEKEISFLCATGPTLHVPIHNTKYLLTHGAQFHGGDGIIGPIGPLMRGENKLRARNAQINQPYDTLVCGHFHTTIWLPWLIVGASLVGYNEYAYRGNFRYETPNQSLWITHPRRGATFFWRVTV